MASTSPHYIDKPLTLHPPCLEPSWTTLTCLMIIRSLLSSTSPYSSPTCTPYEILSPTYPTSSLCLMMKSKQQEPVIQTAYSLSAQLMLEDRQLLRFPLATRLALTPSTNSDWLIITLPTIKASIKQAQQLGTVISQGKEPIAFYSRKLNSAQTCYTTIGIELISIVEAL